MPSKAANAALTDAQKIVQVWSANPTFNMGVVTLADFQAAVAALTAADADVEAQRIELTQLQDARDDQIKALIDLTTRARAGVKSAFGPDSAQYEQAGGTRKSERKPRSTKKKP